MFSVFAIRNSQSRRIASWFCLPPASSRSPLAQAGRKCFLWFFLCFFFFSFSTAGCAHTDTHTRLYCLLSCVWHWLMAALRPQFKRFDTRQIIHMSAFICPSPPSTHSTATTTTRQQHLQQQQLPTGNASWPIKFQTAAINFERSFLFWPKKLWVNFSCLSPSPSLSLARWLNLLMSHRYSLYYIV